MIKRLVIGLPILMIALAAVWLLNYLSIISFDTNIATDNSSSLNRTKQSDSQSSAADTERVPWQLELVATDLSIPWSMVFTSSERMLVTERTGQIRQIVNGRLESAPLYVFPETAKGGEIGLMGMVADPDYQNSKRLFVCVGYKQENDYFDKVVSLIDESTQLTQPQTLIDKIPANRNHAGCELEFGPDNKLYITTGDATDRRLAQDLNSLAGKILRSNTDGSVPADNPFPNSLIYSYGHRNPQGVAWRSNGSMFATEHGPSGFDGPGGGDELNLITPGANYGWPLVSHNQTQTGTVSPLLVFTPAVAPASLIAYSGDSFPQFQHSVLFGLLRGNGIMHVTFESPTSNTIISYQKLDGITVGRVREIQQAPDGLIYFSTSNTDGRGNVTDGDDKIYRLVPSYK